MTFRTQLRLKLSRLFQRLGLGRDWYLVLVAALIGILGGIAALGFLWLLETAQRLYSEIGLHGLLEEGAGLTVVLLLPALGGLTVGTIKWLFRMPLVIHGVPDVIEVLARRRGKMPARSGVFQMINPAISIGTGGSAGAEGPIIHIGSALGSNIGQLLRVSPEHMSTLVGCGAAAAMAAIFNAPIAGVLFVLEVVLRDFSLKTFMPVVVASVFGVATRGAITGEEGLLVQMIGWEIAEEGPLFSLPEHNYPFDLLDTPPYLLLGVLCGLMGGIFVRLMEWIESIWRRMTVPMVAKPALGGLCLGVLGVGYMLLWRNVFPEYEPPAFFSNGYPVVERLLSPESYGALSISILFLVAIAFFKMIGTCLTLGTGGAGGFFAPSLFIGASLGGAFGLLVRQTGLLPELSPAAFALAGMAGVLAASAHCPLTAFILVFELTRDYKSVLPVMLVAILATIISQLITRDSIYTAALKKMGVRVGTMSDLTVLRRITCNEVPLVPAVVVHPEDPAQRLLELLEHYAVGDFVVIDDQDQYVGMVVGDDLRTTLLEREAIPLLVVGELMRVDLPVVSAEETLDVVLDKFSLHDVSSLPVLEREPHNRLLGLITRSRLMRRYQKVLSQS